MVGKKGFIGLSTDNFVTLNTNYIQELLILLYTDQKISKSQNRWSRRAKIADRIWASSLDHAKDGFKGFWWKITKTLRFENYFSKNITSFCFWFSSGLPLLMGKTLQTWMADAKSTKSVGFLPWLVAYTWKFIWSPLVDRFSFPFLGRRRGWLLVTQSTLLFSIAGIGCFEPTENIKFIAIFAILTAFLSASQDIVIDAYRREILSDEALGMGSSVFIYGYRIAMWVSNGLALLVATRVGWRETYFIMAGFMVVGIITTLVAHEPAVSLNPEKFKRSSQWSL